MRRRFPLGAGVVSLLLACSAGPRGSAGDSSSTDTGSATSGATSSDAETSSGDTSAGSAEETTQTSAGCTVGCDLAVPECNLLEQDCPEGEKCVPSAQLTRCVPIVADAGGENEPCTLTDDLDDCGAGLVCWATQAGGGDGACERLCVGDFGNPTCPDEADACAAFRRDEGWYPLCRPKCDPTQGACAADSVCEQSSYKAHFVCAPPGLPTTDENAGLCNLQAAPNPLCAEGLHCDEGLFGCGGGCCYALCDSSAPEMCGFGSCLPLADPVAGFDSLGVCRNG